MDFREHSVIWLAKQIRLKNLSSREVVRASIDNIQKYNPKVNAFVSTNFENALKLADAADKKIASGGDVGLLEGIPVGVKDMDDAVGFKTSMGSNLTDNIPEAQVDSEIVIKLKKLGAIVVGKTNTPEFAWAPDTKNIKFGATLNPWNLEYTAGGSSGGSAAAIASNMVPLATGADGGGSLRIPSAVCGLNVLKPTWGAVSRAQDEHEAWQGLSVSGFMTRRLCDQMALFGPLTEFNGADYNSIKYDYNGDRVFMDGSKPKVIKVGFSSDLGYALVDKEVGQKSLNALKEIVDGLNSTDLYGANKTVFELVEVNSVFDEDPLPYWFNQVGAYNYYNLTLLKDSHRIELNFDNCDPMISFLYQIGASLSIKDLILAQRQGYYMSQRLTKLFRDVDFLVTPTVAGIPPLSGQMGTVNSEPTMNWVQMTYPFNMTKSPAINIFADVTSVGVPMGLQIVGPQLSDYKLIKLGMLIEKVSNFDRVAPLDVF
jgi:aspartyl-tRNA(Asn)/glutamyl-tRNA(Gln) amidotransferase subunit A